MDFINKLSGQHGQGQGQQAQPQQQQRDGGGFMGALNNMADDGLDKGIDYVQQHYMGSGDQSNESALEQAKDQQISDMVRQQYKNMTGKDFPIVDKKL
ncbi:hypothetical protein FRC12_003534 [Ceratobasidium sp. 428]|nr:hypothetical protein FRC12_003534 [Ceratobasidium sp. 428]